MPGRGMGFSDTEASSLFDAIEEVFPIEDNTESFSVAYEARIRTAGIKVLQ